MDAPYFDSNKIEHQGITFFFFFNFIFNATVKEKSCYPPENDFGWGNATAE